MESWIGVDLDGTLAVYDNVWKGVEHIGEPVPAMVERVKAKLAEGMKVKIMTARVYPHRENGDHHAARRYIQKWCEKHLGTVLEVTHMKDYGMLELWDDRARQVIQNTGEFVDER